MPWKVFKNGPESKPYCVQRVNSKGKAVKGARRYCHTSRSSARNQQKRFYAMQERGEIKQMGLKDEQVEKMVIFDEGQGEPPPVVLEGGVEVKARKKLCKDCPYREKEKEGDDHQKSMHGYGYDYMYVPYGLTSFADYDAHIDSQETAQEVQDTGKLFRELARNIFNSHDVEDKGAAIKALANEFAGRVDEAMDGDKTKEVEDPVSQVENSLNIDHLDEEQKGLLSQAFDKVRDLFNNSKEKQEPRKPGMFLFKDKETGRMGFIIPAYSNNFRDEDNPPEIISAESHQNFVKMVDEGEVEPPELWHWHEPALKYGQFTYVGWDESAKNKGFAFGGGLIDEGMEDFAEWVAKGDNLVSHGMPPDSLVRDPEDPTVITKHITREVSTLPAFRAANKLTQPLILTKEGTMGISDEKKQQLLEQGLEAETLEQVEAANRKRLAQAEKDRLESKEAGEEEAAEEATSEETQAAEQESPDEETQEDEQPFTEAQMKALGDALGQVLEPWAKSVNERIDGIEAKVKEVAEEDEEKIAKKAADVPMASLVSQLRSSIGATEAQVDKEKEGDLTKGPKETESDPGPPAEGALMIPGIYNLHKHGSWDGQQSDN